MNFNLDLKVDKAMNRIAESKALRAWTYLIGLIVILGIIFWQLAPILTAISRLIEVLK